MQLLNLTKILPTIGQIVLRFKYLDTTLISWHLALMSHTCGASINEDFDEYQPPLWTSTSASESPLSTHAKSPQNKVLNTIANHYNIRSRTLRPFSPQVSLTLRVQGIPKQGFVDWREGFVQVTRLKSPLPQALDDHSVGLLESQTNAD